MESGRTLTPVLFFGKDTSDGLVTTVGIGRVGTNKRSSNFGHSSLMTIELDSVKRNVVKCRLFMPSHSSIDISLLVNDIQLTKK